MARHFLTDLDVSSTAQAELLARARAMKADPDAYRALLPGKILGMIFQKRSTRTRVSFEAGMIQLGGQAIFLSANDIQIGRGEPIADTGAVLSRYVDIVMIRTFEHAEVRDLAAASDVPVINGLDDRLHPCQALADLMVIQEHKGSLAGLQLAYVGDGNNVSHSLMLAGARAGVHVRVVCPDGYAPADDMLAQAKEAARATGARIDVTHSLDGVADADAVYTDVWASMGQEGQAAARHAQFERYRVTPELMRRAKPDAIFLHCLPAHRGEEVAAAVIDGPQSVVFDQAENRLHTQKALVAHLLGA